MRTHSSGEVNTQLIDDTVTVCGWVHRRRDHGGVIFVDLRDRSGLLQVVFATETLSLGINMPARTVAIERFDKFGSAGRATLPSGEYAQLTGRAGRRGLDQEGHAVVEWSPQTAVSEMARVAVAPPPDLRSTFRPTYNLAVNLVRRYRADQAHWVLDRSFAQFVDSRHHGDTACVVAQTTQSRIRIAVALRTTAQRDGRPVGVTRQVTEAQAAGHHLSVDVARGHEVVVEKVVAVVTSRDPAISEPAETAVEAAAGAAGFAELLQDHARHWEQLWGRFDIALGGTGTALGGTGTALGGTGTALGGTGTALGGTGTALGGTGTALGGTGTVPSGASAEQLEARLGVFHILQTLSPHTADLDAGVPSRGLHGEGYQGHVFWDELFVFPLLDLRLPELTRSLLLYRWRRLPQARRRARSRGCTGALFPWRSASDGSEETPVELYNPRSGRWMPDNSQRQYHVNLAVAYNAWRHWQISGDLGFVVRHGAELLVDTARFFASRATYDPAADRFDLRRVMGPDEFHDGYPDRPGEGVDNNAYVNVMAAWALQRARQTCELLGPDLGRELRSRLDLHRDELDRWEHVSRRLRVPFLDNGLLAQFEGYGDLDELDWPRYRRRYGNVGRLDLILESEGDTPNRYQVSKQADVLMLFYLLSAEELTGLLGRLGYAFDPATIPATVDHYLARTSHGSTLSRVVHAWVLARTDRATAGRRAATAWRTSPLIRRVKVTASPQSSPRRPPPLSVQARRRRQDSRPRRHRRPWWRPPAW